MGGAVGVGEGFWRERFNVGEKVVVTVTAAGAQGRRQQVFSVGADLVKAEVLRGQQRNLPQKLLFGHFHKVVSVNDHRTRRGAFKKIDTSDEGGFTRTRKTEIMEALTTIQLNVNLRDGIVEKEKTNTGLIQ